jgi:hypothetical protein
MTGVRAGRDPHVPDPRSAGEGIGEPGLPVVDEGRESCAGERQGQPPWPPGAPPVAAGENERAGRWRGTEKDECGIHIVDGKVVRSAILPVPIRQES